jgi:hypothetical protein
VDLRIGIGTNGINSTALKVACPPPGRVVKIKHISQKRALELLTLTAALLS